MIRNAGYDKTLILQEFIFGGDDALFDAIIYANSKGSVEFMSFAQIALQERTGGMVGNPVVLMNGVNTTNGDVKSQVEKLKKFIENIGYTGFAGVDMKYDSRTNTFKVLEINARQTRQGYYLTSLGKNLAEVIIDDLVFGKSDDFKLLNEKVLLSFVPKKNCQKIHNKRRTKKRSIK